MEGPEFHEFLIRAGNDRILTDRALELSAADVIDVDRGFFVDFANMGYEQQINDPEEFWSWYQRAQYSFARAPLELIAHVIENDLPYTEILTADYIMANPLAARAYGAPTEFSDAQDLLEFRPSSIVSYFRDDDSKVTEVVDGRTRVLSPGNLATDYPHAGILNTNAFLVRYPSTATNRNRARSRWTYYHFLGLDVEKSASRTTDPVALADTNNPTMHNPACTVCHRVLDPVAGAFQNYGDEGYFLDQWGGLDSLDGNYKEGTDSLLKAEVKGDAYERRQTFEQATWLEPGSSLVIRHYQNNGCGEDGVQTCGRDLRIDDFHIRDEAGRIVDRIEWSELDEHCEYDGQYEAGSSGEDDHYRWWGWECHEIPVQLEESGRYELSVTAWADQAGDEVTSFKFGVNLYQQGDTWYRTMRPPGFDGELVADASSSLQWLANRIVLDPRFSDATVRFWWPAIFGSTFAEPPVVEGETDFEARLLASNSQAQERRRLAEGFRRGFAGGLPYNLKDLLVEIVMSRWFRAVALEDNDSVREAALADAGARRLLTPEELRRKMLAVTGFGWKRRHADEPGFELGEARDWTNLEGQFGLLYGGIDSDGITERAADFTAVMAGIAKRHAAAISCPVVMKEFYLLPPQQRSLFREIDRSVTPTFEFGEDFEIEAASWADRETLSFTGYLPKGDDTVTLSFLNNEAGADPIDRNVRADRVDVIATDGALVDSRELEDLQGTNCGDWGFNGADENRETGTRDHFAFYCNGSLEVPITIPADGRYEIAVVVWADQNPSELAKLRLVAGSDTARSAGSLRIKNKLVDLYQSLHGIEVAVDSSNVASAYELFVDVWNLKRNSQSGEFPVWSDEIDCDWRSDRYYLDGILDDAYLWRDDWGDEWGARHDWDRRRIDDHFANIDWSDTAGIARAWTVVLAYLLMDYRFLYL